MASGCFSLVKIMIPGCPPRYWFQSVPQWSSQDELVGDNRGAGDLLETPGQVGREEHSGNSWDRALN